MKPDPLTPAMTRVLERIRRAGRPPFHTLGAQAARAAYEAGAEVLDLPRAPLAVVENLTLAGRPARRYAVDAASRPTLLYLHGGGFVIGSLETHDSLCRQLALRSGWTVVALDYRLAPEHPFPAAVDDAIAALGDIVDAARGPIAVAGDSAGGTLAAACALQARDRGWPLALQLLITPGTTPWADTPSHRRYAHGYLLDAETIAWFFDQYIPLAQREDPRFSPLRADADGLAPAAFVLAECDPLLDEGLAYADHLRAAGVAVDLHLERGVTHDFIKMGRALKAEAGRALDFAATALQGALRT
jgi:acetyl esterase